MRSGYAGVALILVFAVSVSAFSIYPLELKFDKDRKRPKRSQQTRESALRRHIRFSSQYGNSVFVLQLL